MWHPAFCFALRWSGCSQAVAYAKVICLRANVVKEALLVWIENVRFRRVSAIASPAVGICIPISYGAYLGKICGSFQAHNASQQSCFGLYQEFPPSDRSLLGLFRFKPCSYLKSKNCVDGTNAKEDEMH